MTERPYTIRTATPDEVALAVDWAAGEGWNPGLNDAELYGAIDPGGFLIGLLDDEPVATISAVRYGGGFGFVGFYIVHPDHRGKGLGIRMWNAGLDRLYGRTIGLDGVVAQQENYQASGFTLAYRNVRYQGTGGGAAPDPDATVALDEVPVTQLASYDRPFFPEDRSAFVRAWVDQANAVALGVMQGGRLIGYGVRRPCRQGHKIAPLYADDAATAETLFTALKAGAGEGEPVFLDVPEVNKDAVALAERFDLTVSFETARMYAGPEPDMPLGRVFGVMSFEVG